MSECFKSLAVLRKALFTKIDYLGADLMLVDGDPVSNLGVLLDKTKLLAIMKDGVFHKEPEVRAGRTRWALTAA